MAAAGRRERLPAGRLPAQRGAGRGAGRDARAATASKLDAVLDLEVPEDEVVKRIAGRRICRNDSAHVFHVDVQPAEDGGRLRRLRRRAVPARRRHARRRSASVSRSTTRETEPIIDYYKRQGLVVTISALGKVDRGDRARHGGPQEVRRGAEPRPSTPRSSAAAPSGVAADCCAPYRGVRLATVPAPYAERRRAWWRSRPRSRSRRCARRGWWSPPSTRRPVRRPCPAPRTKDLDEVAAQGDRRPRRQVELPRLRRIPRQHLHLGQRRRRARHPGREDRAQGRRHHLDRRRRDHRRLARRRRATPCFVGSGHAAGARSS